MPFRQKRGLKSFSLNNLPFAKRIRSLYKNDKDSNEHQSILEVTADGTKKEKKKEIIFYDLSEIKWAHMKVKRGVRNGIYPQWSRKRCQVYRNRSDSKQFTNVFISKFQRKLGPPVPTIEKEVQQTPKLYTFMIYY